MKNYISDVSHIVMINPLVENLFHVDDKIWNEYWLIIIHILILRIFLNLIILKGMNKSYQNGMLML